MMSEKHTWNILKDHFKERGFVHHQTESFDQFVNVGIHKIITEEPEICITTKGSKSTGYSRYRVSFSNVYVPKPTVTEDTRVLRSFYPSEARQRDLTYDSPIYATVTETLEIEGKEPEVTEHVRVVLGRIPIMLRSSKCYLTNMTPDERISAGECEHDQGGYFVIKGKERVLISQLRGVYNIPLVIEQRAGDKYRFCCDMRSMSEETGHSVLVSAMIGSDDRTLCFSLPYIKDPIPMGIVFKAMGYSSEQFTDLIGTPKGAEKYIRLISNDSFFVDEQGDLFDIFVLENQHIVANSLNVDETTADGKKKIMFKLKEMWKTENLEHWKKIATRNNALRFIGQRTNHPIKEAERKDYAEQVVDCEIFPHMGVTSSTADKAYLLGHMVNKLLSTSLGHRKPDDRDNYVNKRVESPGVLCHELFRQLFKKYVGTIVATIEKKKQLPDVMSIIPRLTEITKGFNHCFGTGNWGVPKNSYVRAGVAQILSRLSYGATLSNLRRVSIPVGKESKNAAIRQINPSQIMYICPVETPEGAPVGIVLNLSLLTRISDRTPTVLVKEVIELCENMSQIGECEKDRSKVFLNGILLGGTECTTELVEEIKELRRIKMLPWDVSISYEKVDNEVHICSDEGRLLRPVFKVDGEKILAEEKDGTNWDELVEKGFIEYIDNMEANGSVIAFHQKELTKFKSDYCEISPAMMLGVMASIIPFPDHSQSPRNCYQCLHVETLVVMADNTKKAIKDIKIGDSVVSVDPITCVQTTTKVINQYVRETEKEIISVETESGRKITCTVDHPVLTTDGWKHAIDAENICVIPQQVVYSGGDEDLYITLPETSVKEKHINDLKSIGLYPIKSTLLPVLARIVGYLITDGSAGLYDKGPQVQFSFGSPEGCEDFLKDVFGLGFSVNKVIDVTNEKYGKCKQIIYNNALASLLIALVDGYVGKRTTQSHPPLMNWIKNGSMLVKREFLSGFQGGDGCKLRANKLAGRKSTNFILNSTSLTSRLEYVNSLVEFMKEIKVLFEEFDIECSGPLIRKAQHSDESKTVHLYFKNTRDNHINYFEKIGWRYDIFKYLESLPVYEYQKMCQKAIDDIILERQIIKKYLEDGMTIRQISDKLIKTYEYISDSLRCIKENRDPRIPNSFESYTDWKRQVRDRAIFVKIVSKTRWVKGNMIADITTESENHSFIAGDSFCVHNSSMGKQAMSMFALSHLTRADTVVHVLNTPQRPLVGTKAAEMMGFNDMPSGLNCIVAIACYTGFNQEDSVILNYSAVQRGLFWATTYKTHSDEEKKQGYNSEKICIPPIERRKHDANYGLLDENGIVRLRHPKWIDEKGKIRGGDALFVQKGDVIIGKISIQSDKSGNEILSDCSVVIGKGEEGYIDRIFSTITPNGYKLVKIVIRCLRIPEVGDKFASRAAQKGTVGMVYKQEDMPFTREGIVPDIIINPHCLADDHEILTEHGFMNWKEAKQAYDKGTLKMAGYDHQTGRLVYEYPTAFILNETKTQEMIEFTHKGENNNKVSLLVTTDHDMFAKCGKMHGEYPTWNGKQIGPRGSSRRVADDYKKIKACELVFSDIIKFTGKAREGIEGDITNIPFLNLLSIDTPEKLVAFCELYGYWLGDGCLKFGGNSVEMSPVKLSDDDWLRTRFNILELVLSVDYTYNVIGGNGDKNPIRFRWSIINKNWFNIFCSEYGKKYKKYKNSNAPNVTSMIEQENIKSAKWMAPWVWKLPADLACSILTGLRFADGSEKANRNIIWTSSARFRDEIVRLALHGGYSAYFGIQHHIGDVCGTDKRGTEIVARHISWRVSYTNTARASEPVLHSNNDVKKVQYTGLTWCVTMPHGFIITRRAKRDSNDIVVEASRPIITGQCIPSRMTINQLIESVMGKSCAINGKYGDATPFTKESKNIAEEACKTLGMLGYESTGKEMLMNGMTGENMGMFFIGPVYYQRLKHLVSDKMHARATGPVTTLTRQPLEGRSRDGGQRFGEMERDCGDYRSPIPLNCGLSVELGTMENKNYIVLSYHEEKQQIIPSVQSNFLSKGERECVDVVFQDGRTIRFTDNHKMLTSENVWVPICEMVKGITQLKTGITNPLIIVKEEIEKCSNWKFQAGDTRLKVKDEESYFQALSFARLVGYFCADGGIYRSGKTYNGILNLGHEIDVSSALEDLGKFTMITQENFTKKNYYCIRIPQNFVSDLMKIEGMLVGKKINQPALLPTFITDPDCPLPIVREFLGGLFGGDGHTCVLGLHRGKRDLLTSVSFSKSKSGSQLESLEKMMEQLQILLARFDIHNVTIQKAKETTSSKKKVDSLQENKSYQLTLHICIDDLPIFHEKIGFRYCCHKSQRLEAGASYKRLRDGVTRQHNWLVDRVDEISQFSKIKKEFPNKIVHTKKAIEKAVKELTEKEALLHEYAIPSTHDITDHLVKGTKFGNFRGKGFPNAEEYLKDIGALDWFLQEEPVKLEINEPFGESPPCEDSTPVSYGVGRKCKGLPTMNLRVIDIRPAGVHPVYDIQVDETHTFLANGIVAHNCMIGHGVSKFLQERLFLVSDKYQVSICSKCGNFATSKTECRACDTDQVLPVKLPYVGKLVLQELNAMMLKTKITAK